MTPAQRESEARRLDEAARARWQALLAQDGDELDEDGYPTDLVFERLKHWHWSDPKGWLAYAASLWHYRDSRWTESEEPHEWRADVMVCRYRLSTGGWSGNEALIRAMESNHMLWGLYWLESRRGGYYAFEVVPLAKG